MATADKDDPILDEESIDERIKEIDKRITVLDASIAKNRSILIGVLTVIFIVISVLSKIDGTVTVCIFGLCILGILSQFFPKPSNGDHSTPVAKTREVPTKDG